VVTEFPRSDSAKALRAMSERVLALPKMHSEGGLGFFVERLIEYRSGSV
jgi:flagellar biosynthesis protein FlhG